MKELPSGEDDTVNNTTPEEIRALFDTAPNNVPKSILSQGIGSWIKFGLNVKGTRSFDISTIARQQIAKAKFRKKFQELSIDKHGKKLTSSKKNPVPPIQPKLDHRNYGAWYIKPNDWESRFKKLSGVRTCDKITLEEGGMAKDSESLGKQRSESLSSNDKKQDKSLSQLYSTRAFAQFLSRRRRYDPPHSYLTS